MFKNDQEKCILMKSVFLRCARYQNPKIAIFTAPYCVFCVSSGSGVGERSGLNRLLMFFGGQGENQLIKRCLVGMR